MRAGRFETKWAGRLRGPAADELEAAVEAAAAVEAVAELGPAVATTAASDRRAAFLAF